jgi:alpha-D-ribose 1-methylphosphonate 5-triphosphate synthase subunit PhnG
MAHARRDDGHGKTDRQNWMAVLARSSRAELEEIIARHGGAPEHAVLKAAETGTVMVEGRAGGAGRRFNLGEATMTRCVVRLGSGTLGYAYALGTDKRKALLSALLDGMIQDEVDRRVDAALMQDVERLAALQQAQCELTSRKAAATKVDFFTLVRGHD